MRHGVCKYGVPFPGVAHLYDTRRGSRSAWGTGFLVNKYRETAAESLLNKHVRVGRTDSSHHSFPTPSTSFFSSTTTQAYLWLLSSVTETTLSNVVHETWPWCTWRFLSFLVVLYRELFTSLTDLICQAPLVDVLPAVLRSTVLQSGSPSLNVDKCVTDKYCVIFQ